MTVDFLVKPAMLLAARDNINGNAGATAVTSQKPASLDIFSSTGKSFTMSIPVIATRKMQTSMTRRDFRITDVRTADRITVTSWKPEAGSPMRIVWNLSYPKPLIIKVLNCRCCQP
jgi:hypothetical protein